MFGYSISYCMSWLVYLFLLFFFFFFLLWPTNYHFIGHFFPFLCNSLFFLLFSFLFPHLHFLLSFRVFTLKNVYFSFFGISVLYFFLFLFWCWHRVRMGRNDGMGVDGWIDGSGIERRFLRLFF